jgi:hypothetical protein
MNIILALKHEALKIRHANLLATIITDLQLDDPCPVIATGSTPAGHEQRLRGIPVVGAKGVGGTIAQTDPLRETLRRERLRERGLRV